MKKRVAILLTMAIGAMNLTACGNATSGNDASQAYLSGITASDYVTLGEYKGVTVEAESPSVSDEDVETYINTVLTSYADKVEVTDRAVQEGDTVNIDYVGKYADSGEAFDGGSAEGYDLTIGSNTFIDGFEEGLIGANTGDVVDLNLTFPEDYSSTDLAGKDVVFTVTVNKITTAPELTDEYVASLGLENVSTIDEFKAYVKETLLTNEQEDYEDTIATDSFETVFNSCVFQTPPTAMIERFTEQFNDYAGTLASYYSTYYSSTVTADDVLSMSMSQQGFSGDATEFAEQNAIESAERYIMCQAIADAEGIEVTDEEVEEAITEAISNSGASYSGTDDYLTASGLDREEYKESLLAQKVQDFIAENANVVEPEGE